MKLKDVTDHDIIHQSYATGSLQKAYNNNVLRRHSKEISVSGVTGMPSMELAIQSDITGGHELEESGVGSEVGVVPHQLTKESDSRPLNSSHTQTLSTNTTSAKESSSSLSSQTTEFHSTVETTDYGPYGNNLPTDGDAAINIKQEPIDDGEDIGSDGAIDMETKTESLSDGEDADLASMGELEDTLDDASIDTPQDETMMYPIGGSYDGASSSLDNLPSKPYQCAVCHKAFRSIQVLQKHTQTMHRRPQSKMYQRGAKSRGVGGKRRGPYRTHSGHQLE